MTKNLIDTNLIIRFLVNDEVKKANAVSKLLKTKSKNFLPDVIIAEIIWVLNSYYEFTKEEIIEKIRALIHVDSIICNKNLLDKSLSIWQKNNLSFIDSYLAALSESEKLKLYSYDVKFDNLKIKRFEP